jgi:hypothetical protein
VCGRVSGIRQACAHPGRFPALRSRSATLPG